jgi:uncharacterized protein (DUF885 family)
MDDHRVSDQPVPSDPDSPIRALADELVRTLLAADPLHGSSLGLREYDALMPDPCTAAEDALVDRLRDLAGRAEHLTATDTRERATLGTVRAWCEHLELEVANRADEYTVTAMPFAGPATLLAVAARTVLPDTAAAADYLARLTASPDWIDGTTERLREGRAKGTLPIAGLVDQAREWADRVLAAGLPPEFLAPAPPAGWTGEAAWRDQVSAVVRDGIMPALARWRELLIDLRPDARPADRAGLVALPDGERRYQRAIAVHTTLPLSAEELHAIGLQTVAELEDRALELGSPLGLRDLPAILAAVRASGEAADAESALAAARATVLRAEQAAPRLMPGPLPEPCAVEPMPESVARSGMAPHYTRPREGRAGTFWFNTLQATAGTGWDMEAVAFHEAVPGHHSQLARLQRLADLPLLQQLSVTVHSEGWGLYAEQLAGEFGLYSDARAELGAVFCTMLRAVRLVVDTGLHALGWSRERAIAFMVEHTAQPEGFLVNEIDRYLTMPGQALAYLTGQREILRLRADARARLGDAFDLPGFHGAVLDNGSLPMPVLAETVADWVEAAARA